MNGMVDFDLCLFGKFVERFFSGYSKAGTIPRCRRVDWDADVIDFLSSINTYFDVSFPVFPGKNTDP